MPRSEVKKRQRCKTCKSLESADKILLLLINEGVTLEDEMKEADKLNGDVTKAVYLDLAKRLGL
tara:strand:- start:30723 stop:30914 length:192 start_codon:yes stop_codon:yes gene_type:complete